MEQSANNNKTKDWADVLAQCGFDVPENINEFNVKCPFHDDRTPSLSINIDKGVWVCHAGCGKGRLAPLVARCLNISLIAADALAKHIKQDSWMEGMFNTEEEQRDVELLPVDDSHVTWGQVPQWTLDRGFSRAILSRWGCGYIDNGILVIPIVGMEGQNVGLMYRYPSGVAPRYRYSKDAPVSRVLFGSFQLKHSNMVCATEGALNTIWLNQHGFQSIALLGSHMSQAQKELMLYDVHCSELILCFDNDNAGKHVTEQVTNELGEHFVISTIKLPEQYNDVQDVRESMILRDIILNRSILRL